MKILWVSTLLFGHIICFWKPCRMKQSESPPSVPPPDQSLRLILRQFLHDIQVDYQIDGPVRREVQIKISRHSMSVLSKYLNNSDADLPEDREAVRASLSKVFKVIGAASDPTWQDTIISLQPFIITLNIFILPAAAVVVIRSILRPRNFRILMFSTFLFISMYSGFNRKYQEAESRRFARFQESSKDACAPKGLLSRIVEFVASPFQYRQKSNCLKYIESQTISIFNEISIIEVFSETISDGFFAFLSTSAKHVNLFFRNLYDGVPILAQIVTTFFVFSMIVKIRTPFFSYEPIWLTFCSSSIGKIARWIEGGEEEHRPVLQLNVPAKELKRLEQAKTEKFAMTEYSKSEQEEDASECENGKKKKNEKETELMKKEEDSAADMDTPVKDDLSLLDESSENEEDISEFKMYSAALNKTINSSLLSNSSF